MRYGTIATIAATVLLGAAPATAATRTFPVAGFDRVRSTVPFDVHVHAGRRPGARADGDQATLDRLDIRVEGGVLTIGMKRSGFGFFSDWGRRRVATIDVGAPSIRGLGLSGPGNLDADRVGGRDVTLEVSGPGTMRVGMVEAGAIDARVSGPGNLDAAGRASRVRIAGSGPGNVRLGRVQARDVDVTLSGPGDVEASASGTAAVRLSGPGDVRIGGRPRCSVQKSGPGSVSCG